MKIKEEKDKTSKKNKSYIWVIKITIITFFLGCFFSFISEITSSMSSVVIAMLLLVLLILVSIVFDGIGVAATSCDLAPLLSMASRKVPGSKMAVILVKNAEKVSNICSDVIGDICGIVSGACSLTIVIKIMGENSSTSSIWVNILFSSVVAAVTVGGKAFLKGIAVKNSKELIMFSAKLINFFYKVK